MSDWNEQNISSLQGICTKKIASSAIPIGYVPHHLRDGIQIYYAAENTPPDIDARITLHQAIDMRCMDIHYDHPSIAVDNDLPHGISLQHI